MLTYTAVKASNLGKTEMACIFPPTHKHALYQNEGYRTFGKKSKMQGVNFPLLTKNYLLKVQQDHICH
jgi:hypothetical protein